MALEDLMPIVEVPEIAYQFGTLKKAEMHVTEVVWSPGYFQGQSELGGPQSYFMTEVYYRGQLHEGTRVRMKKTKKVVAIDVRSIPQEKWSEEVQKKAEALKKSSQVRAGDKMGVYWFSKEILPTPFQDERYVMPISADGAYLLRSSEISQTEYREKLEQFTPPLRGGVKQIQKEAAAFRKAFMTEREKRKEILARYSLNLGQLPLQEIENIAAESLPQTTWNILTVQKGCQNYPHYLSMFTAFDVRSRIINFFREKHPHVDWGKDDAEEILHKFSEEAISQLDLLMRTSPVLPDYDQMHVTLERALDTAYINSGFSISVTPKFGGFGGGERRKKK